MKLDKHMVINIWIVCGAVCIWSGAEAIGILIGLGAVAFAINHIKD